MSRFILVILGALSSLTLYSNAMEIADLTTETTETVLAANFQRVKEITLDKGASTGAYSPLNNTILMGSFQGCLELLDIKLERITQSVNSIRGAILSVAFNADGTKAIFSSTGKVAYLMDTIDGKIIHPFQGHQENIPSVAYSPDGETVLTGSMDATASLWDTASGKEIFSFQGHTDTVLAVAYSPDSQKILTGSQDGTARLWDALTNEQLQIFKGHDGAIQCVAFDPHGTTILTGSSDCLICVWDSVTGAQLIRLIGHTSGISCLSYNHASTLILSASSNGEVRLWDAQTGDLLQQLPLKKTPETRATIYLAAFSPDDEVIVTGSTPYNENEEAHDFFSSSTSQSITISGYSSTTGTEASLPSSLIENSPLLGGYKPSPRDSRRYSTSLEQAPQEGSFIENYVSFDGVLTGNEPTPFTSQSRITGFQGSVSMWAKPNSSSPFLALKPTRNNETFSIHFLKPVWELSRY